MAASALKAVVVGTNIGCAKHVAGLRGGGFEVAGLLGRDPARTAERAIASGVPTAFRSLEEALDTDVDAVVVATPPESHHAIVMRALAAGKHVLCEKPFALDVARAEEMRDVAREAGLVGHVVHQLRWFDTPVAVREHVVDGAVGRPLHGLFAFDHLATARGTDRMPEWWLHAERGGGWLHNYASHGVDLIRFMLGEFTAVAAALDGEPSRGMSSDDRYAVVFRLADGLQGTMSGTCRARETLDYSRIVGDRATLSFDGAGARLTDDAGRTSIRPKGAGLASPDDTGGAGTPVRAPRMHDPQHGAAEQARMCRAFGERIRRPGFTHPSIATFDDGVAHMRVLGAIVEAARTRRWVETA